MIWDDLNNNEVNDNLSFSSLRYRKVVSNNCTDGVREQYTAKPEKCPGKAPRGLRIVTADGKLTAEQGHNVTLMVQLEEVGLISDSHWSSKSMDASEIYIRFCLCVASGCACSASRLSPVYVQDVLAAVQGALHGWGLTPGFVQKTNKQKHNTVFHLLRFIPSPQTYFY